MKKIILLAISLSLVATILCGCESVEPINGSSTESSSTAQSSTVSSDEATDTSSTTSSQEVTTTTTTSAAKKPEAASVTFSAWSQMNTNAKYENMQAIVDYINSTTGTKVSVSLADLVTYVDGLQSDSKTETVYSATLSHIQKMS